MLIAYGIKAKNRFHTKNKKYCCPLIITRSFIRAKQAKTETANQKASLARFVSIRNLIKLRIGILLTLYAVQIVCYFTTAYTKASNISLFLNIALRCVPSNLKPAFSNTAADALLG